MPVLTLDLLASRRFNLNCWVNMTEVFFIQAVSDERCANEPFLASCWSNR